MFKFYAYIHFSSLELEPLHWSLLLLKHKLLLTFIHLRCNTRVLFFNTKIMFYEFKSLLVDLLVFMPLKKFNFIKSIGFLYEGTIRIDADSILLDSCSPRRRIFSSPFKATWTIFESITVRRSQRGLVQPSATKYLICSGVPPDVALVMAHAASFLVRNSAFWRISINIGKIFASITA